MLALVEGNSLGLGLAARSSALLATAAVGLTAFAVVERRVRVPMVEFSFFRSRTFLGANGVAFIVSFAMLAMFFFMALYMQNILGYSAARGRRALPALDAGDHLHAPLAGRLTDRIGATAPIAVGLALRRRRAVHAVAHRPSTPATATCCPAFILMGIGMGLVDVADVHGRDERGAAAEGRRRVGHPVDEPDGRRHVRRGRLGALFQRIGPTTELVRLAGRPGSARPSRTGSWTTRLGTAWRLTRSTLPPAVGDALRNAFIHALSSALWLSAAVAAVGVVFAC